MTSTTRTDALNAIFDNLSLDGPARPDVPPHRRVLTPAETKAAETTRVAREHTDAESDQRQAQVARLKQARLEKEAAAAVEAAEAKAAKAAAPKKSRKKAG